MGASRRQHHRRVEAERAAGIEATRLRIAQEEAQRRMQQLAESLRPEPIQMPEPARRIQSTTDLTRGGVRTARSTRGTIRGLSRGLAQLRIPLNIGGGTGGGLNIG